MRKGEGHVRGSRWGVIGPVRSRAWWCGALALSVLVIGGGAAALPQTAFGAAFQRGDVFTIGANGINEYSPVGAPPIDPGSGLNTGQLRQTVAAPGAAALCFDPSGDHLIVPGAGLFDRFGHAQPSNWASVTNIGRCAADGLGHVYLSSEQPSSDNWILTEYSLTGHPIRTLGLSVAGLGPLAVSLAPDECTMYYAAYAGPVQAGRFNVCTNTQLAPLIAAPFSLTDDVSVLPNWDFLTEGDGNVGLFDQNAQPIRFWTGNGIDLSDMRTLSLDPDGTSFWAGGFVIDQVDLGSSQILEHWRPASSGIPASESTIAVYGPPLLGDADVEKLVDSNPAGTAEAFVTRAGFSGQTSRLHLYVDSRSTARKVVVGVYSDKRGHPGALQAQSTLTNIMSGSWNYVDVPPVPVSAGQRYWIAVLAPRGAGTIRFRDTSSGPGSTTSAQRRLAALPAQWSTGTVFSDGNLSAYGS